VTANISLLNHGDQPLLTHLSIVVVIIFYNAAIAIIMIIIAIIHIIVLSAYLHNCGHCRTSIDQVSCVATVPCVHAAAVIGSSWQRRARHFPDAGNRSRPVLALGG
jgi:hypothetical protein